MVELRSPRDNSLTGNLRLCIKMIDRSSVPTPNVVKEFIANTGDEENAAYGSLISCSYGQELSSATTAKVVLGAPVSRYLDREIADCVPMFGRGSGEGTWQMGPVWSNNPLSGGLYNPAKAGKFIRANELYTNANLYDPYFWFTVVVPGYGQYNVTLMELRMLTGQQPRRAWSHFKVFQTLAGREPNGGKATELRYQPWFADIRISQKDFDLIINNQVPAMTAQQTSYNQNDKKKTTEK